jgi:dihydrodipicolinate reductase
MTKWETEHRLLNETVVILHAGSGRQLNECIAFCARTKSVLIELSTGLETETIEADFPLIICPNTSILLLKTLKMLNTYGGTFHKYEITILESHQATKQTEPGTAYAFAKSLKFPVNKVISVREPEIQRNQIGISEEFLAKHAYHKIVIKDGQDELTIETKVLGHNSYTNGIKKLIEAVQKLNLENRRYTVLEILDSGLL